MTGGKSKERILVGHIGRGRAIPAPRKVAEVDGVSPNEIMIHREIR